jgi:predicted permease
MQVTLSIVLLTGAILLLRSVENAAFTDPGFQLRNVSWMNIELPASMLAPEKRDPLFRALHDEIAAVSDPESYAFTTLVPISGSLDITSMRKPGEELEQERYVAFQRITPGLFDVLGVPLLRGRKFETSDRGRQLLIVNESFAERYFPGEDPIGKTILADEPHEIVGIVRDAQLVKLGEVDPAIFFPLDDTPAEHIVFRSEDVSQAELIKGILQRLEPGARLVEGTLEHNLSRELAPARVAAGIAGGLGLFALFLASLGMFGVFAFVVRQRTREIGIRMALGARAGQVVRTVLWMGGRAVLVGSICGLFAAMGLSRLLDGHLYGISHLDPLTYAAVATIILAAATASCFLPTMQAVRIEPVEALRHE